MIFSLPFMVIWFVFVLVPSSVYADMETLHKKIKSFIQQGYLRDIQQVFGESPRERLDKIMALKRTGEREKAELLIQESIDLLNLIQGKNEKDIFRRPPGEKNLQGQKSRDAFQPAFSKQRKKKGKKKFFSPESDSIERTGFVKRLTVVPLTEGGGVRPEIVATEKRVFVVYHGNIAARRGSTFNVKILDSTLEKEIATKTLIHSSKIYGNPTDSRVTSDGDYLYLFYETADIRKGKSYLWGAKYTLDDNFEKVTYTRDPIAVSTTFNTVKTGDEKLDDPASVISGDAIFVITRLKTFLKKTGKTIYRIRKFTKDFKKLSEFDLDLSNEVDGQARVTSILYQKGYFYMVMPTTVGEVKAEVGLVTPSDIMMIKLDENWKIAESKVLSAEPNDAESYLTGFKTDGTNFYLTYNQVKFGRGVQSVLKIYDSQFNLLHKEIIKKPSGGKGKKGTGPTSREGIRPSLEIFGNRILLGNQDKKSAEIYVYDKEKIEKRGEAGRNSGR